MAKLGMFFKTLGMKIATLWKTTTWFKIASIGGAVVVATSAVVIPNAVVRETGGIFHKCDFSVESIDAQYSYSEANCTEKAKYYYSCACGEKGSDLFEYGDVLGHDLTHHTNKQVTCTEIGYEEYDTCSRCNYSTYSEIPATGHTDGEWIIDANATCTENGSKHQICSVCSDTINSAVIPATGHTDGEWIIDANPTCTENGSKHQICSVCSDTINTAVIPATGHTDGEWITDREANCTEDGSKHQVCSVCNDTIKTETLTSFGHNYKENLPPKACIDKSIVYQCQNCEDAYSIQLQEISANIDYCYWSYVDSTRYVQDVLSINGIQGGYGKYTITITYTDPRRESHVYTYTNVDNLYTTKYLGGASWGAYYRQSYPPFVIIEIEDELGFKTTYTAYFPTLNPDKYLDGYNLYSQEVTITVLTETVKHTAGEWIVSKEATCTSDGEKIQQCILCETILSTNTIPKNHSYTTTNSFPTCLSNGSTTLTCTECSYSHTEEWLPITFEIERGNYYLNQGQNVIYYLELTVKNITGGRVAYDEFGNRIKNTYTVLIYNTLTQEIGEFQITNGQTNFASMRFYGGTDIFGSSVFQITINDGYSSYVYFLDRYETVAELIDIPTQHHNWNFTTCGQNATCSLCNAETRIEHESVNNVCVNCHQTTYMPTVTYSTEIPLNIHGGEIESVSFAFSPYTTSDMSVTLNITVLGWKSSTNSLIGFNIKIYDNSSGMLILSRNELMGSEVASGDFSREISCSLIKSGNYRIVISSYF